ncbi:hypothetical protein [Pseudonocardia sp.]|uniref:hypothetical protein n=1 Tax=Pseudonocardia sp. TaxID=60912 RepID=UPI003D0A4C14
MLLVVAGAIGTVGTSVHGAAETQTAREDKAAAETTAVEVAKPLARICGSNPAAAAEAGADCGMVSAVASGVPGAVGATGATGAAGRGITGTAIGADGHLTVSYDDGSSRDVGKVVGADGRGIATTTLDGGRLVLVYSDGTRVDLGGVVGPAGRSITAAATDGGRLVLTLDDGSTLDAGPLPAGPAGQDGQPGSEGPPGPAGPACPDGYQAVVVAGPVFGEDGTRYSRAITCVDPTSASGG